MNIKILLLWTESMNLNKKKHEIINLMTSKSFYWILTKTWNRSTDRRHGVSSDCRLGRTTKMKVNIIQSVRQQCTWIKCTLEALNENTMGLKNKETSIAHF